MIGFFYYLAAYTAARAVGFTQSDAAEIARAVRCALESSEEIEGLYAALHYPLGDIEEILALAAPAQLENPETVRCLPLVCAPSKGLAKETVRWAKDAWDNKSPGRRETVGIALCALANAVLHQGFCGVESAAVNGVAGIMTAKAIPPSKLRDVLVGVQEGRPLETLVELEAYVLGEAPSSFLGAAQLNGLEEQPGQIFTYLSPWRNNPSVACVNPLRFAEVYLRLRAALDYIRTGARCDSLEYGGSPTDIAVFFACMPSKEAELTAAWRGQFSWCGEVPAYAAPSGDADCQFAEQLRMSLLRYRDLVWRERPALLAAVTAEAEMKKEG